MLAFVNVAVSFAPSRVAYSDLKSTSHELRDILERDGVVAITDVPGFKTAREEALGAASRCVAVHPEASSRTFHDGTKRRTLAATPETKMPASLDGTPCATFEAAATSLRAATADATAAFSAALGRAVDLPAPLLDADDEDVTISQMLDNAEVLEHFHSYTLPRAAAPPTGDGGVPTVDVHTDQGLFIAFTPALVAGAESSPSDAATFVIEQPGGRRVAAELDPHTLIFMLGDGIEQLVNPHLRAAGRSPLRPVPHAVEMRARADGAARAWYGRMVLPPAALIAPDHGGATYGRVRELLKAGTTGDDDGVALGCSRDTASRRMQWAPAVPECAEGTMYCWHRCMNLTGDTLLDHPHPVHGDYFPFGPDATDCAAQGLKTQCVDALDTLPPSSQHGDFFPACTNTTKPKVSLAISHPLPGAKPPAEEPAWGAAPEEGAEACAETDEGCEFTDGPHAHDDSCEVGSAEWDSFAKLGEYAASRELWGSCGGGWGQPGSPCLRGVLAWRVVDGIVHAKMAVGGLFGWLAFGFENPGGHHNGMNGAPIVMAMPGGDFDDRTGLDLTQGPQVDEYIINEHGGSAFRLWKEPVRPASLVGASVETSDCFSSMTFATAAIAGQPLPAAGNATYIWATNNEDSYVGYHGRSNGNRGKLEIDWSVGVVEAEPEPEMGRYLEVGAQCAPGGMRACAPPSSCLCNGAARSARALLFASTPTCVCA